MAEQELSPKLAKALLDAAIVAKATGKFADVDDVKGAISPDDVLNDDGTVDEEALTAALDALLKKKPHWAAGGKPPGPGALDQGARGGKAGQLTREDLKGMSPEAITRAK